MVWWGVMREDVMRENWVDCVVRGGERGTERDERRVVRERGVPGRGHSGYGTYVQFGPEELYFGGQKYNSVIGSR